MVKKSKKKDTVDESLLREEALSAALKAMSTRFGDVQMGWVETMPNDKEKVIPTGSLALDNALGVGGVVLGRAYEFFGIPSSGKSTLAYSVLINATKKGYKCLYIDAEHAFDKDLFIKMGGNADKVIVVRGYTGEEQLDIADSLISTGAIDICVFDSVAALVPTAEAEQDSYGDQSMGLHARLMSKMARGLIPLGGRTNTALIFINQLRSSIGNYSGPVTTGGNAIPYFCSVRISVSGSAEFKSSRIENPKTGLVVGHKVNFRVVKNKMAPPFREASANLIYGVGFDVDSELIDLALDTGLIDQAGAWFTYKDTKLQGRNGVLKFLKEDAAAKQEILFDVMNILGLDRANYPEIISEQTV